MLKFAHNMGWSIVYKCPKRELICCSPTSAINKVARPWFSLLIRVLNRSRSTSAILQYVYVTYVRSSIGCRCEYRRRLPNKMVLLVVVVSRCVGDQFVGGASISSIDFFSRSGVEQGVLLHSEIKSFQWYEFGHTTVHVRYCRLSAARRVPSASGQRSCNMMGMYKFLTFPFETVARPSQR